MCPVRSRRLAHAQGRLLQRDDCVGGNAVIDGGAGSDDRAAADGRGAAEDRRVGVDHDVLFDRRMSLRGADQVPLLILGEAERAERHSLIELHAGGDLACGPDYDARAVVDEERRADGRSGVDVDSRPTVRPLGQHPRDQRHRQAKQFVREAVDGDRLQPRIAEDDFIEIPGGGVSVERGLHVGRQRATDRGERLQELDRLLLTDRLEVGLDLAAVQLVSATEVVPEGAGDLLSQPIVQSVDQVADVIRDVAEVQILPLAVAGEENLLQIVGDADDRLDARQRAVTEVVGRFDFLIRIDDAVGQFGKPILETNVCRHETRLV